MFEKYFDDGICHMLLGDAERIFGRGHRMSEMEWRSFSSAERFMLGFEPYEDCDKEIENKCLENISRTPWHFIPE